MMDIEGAAPAADVSVVGSEQQVRTGIKPFADAGATDFCASVIGDADERERTWALLAEWAAS